MSLVTTLMDQLGGSTAGDIGRQLDLDSETTSNAIAGALPMLLGGLVRNSRESSGAEALLGALDRDHDGSVLDDLTGYLSSGPGRHGDGVLGHVFGQKRPAVESSLAQVAGIDAGKAGQLLTLLAPLVMGFLGRQKRERSLDPRSLADLLGGEQRKAPAEAGQAMDMVGQLLDRDGDGSFVDDVADLGAGLLGGLLRPKR